MPRLSTEPALLLEELKYHFAEGRFSTMVDVNPEAAAHYQVMLTYATEA
jgi:hypothetical protein